MRAKKRISRIAYHTVVLAVGFVMIYGSIHTARSLLNFTLLHRAFSSIC